MTLFPAVLVLVDRRHLERARERRPRAQQIERLHVPVLDRLTALPRHRARLVRRRDGPRPLGAALGRLRLQPAQPAGQGDGIGGLGAAHPRRHRPLRLQRPRLREHARRAPGEAARLRALAVGLRGGLGGAGDPGWPGGEDRHHQELRAPGRPRSGSAARARWTWSGSARRSPTSSAASTWWPRRRARSSLPSSCAIRKQTAALTQRAQDRRPRDGRARAELPAGAALPGFRDEVLQPPAEPEPAARSRSRTSPPSSAASSWAGTGASSSRSTRRWTSGSARAPQQFVGELRSVDPGRHRRARHHLRGDPADGARLSPGHGPGLHPRRGPDRADDPPGQGIAARPAAARARPRCGRSGSCTCSASSSTSPTCGACR